MFAIQDVAPYHVLPYPGSLSVACSALKHFLAPLSWRLALLAQALGGAWGRGVLRDGACPDATAALEALQAVPLLAANIGLMYYIAF